MWNSASNLHSGTATFQKERSWLVADLFIDVDFAKSRQLSRLASARVREHLHNLCEELWEVGRY